MSSTGLLNPTRSGTRLDGVDLLRGLAILFVLVNHVNGQLSKAGVPYARGLPRHVVYSVLFNGRFGVQIFFAVSGFLITSTALRRWGSLSIVDVRAFYRLRFARIVPLLLLLLGVLSILDLANMRDFVVSPNLRGLARTLFAALTFRINVLIAYRGPIPASWGILWSLSVEEVFYLFFPIVCRLHRRRNFLVGLFAVVVILGPFGRTVFANGNDLWKLYSYLGGMDAIALGCLTAMFTERTRFSARALRAFALGGCALLIFSLYYSNQAGIWGLGRTGLNLTILAIGTCMIIVAAAQTQWRSPRIMWPLLRLGQRSYEVYLTHIFVVLICFQVFLAVGKPLRGVVLLFVAVIVISGLFGEVAGRFYSEPMNRLLRKKWRDGPQRLGLVITNAT